MLEVLAATREDVPQHGDAAFSSVCLACAKAGSAHAALSLDGHMDIWACPPPAGVRGGWSLLPVRRKGL